MLLPNSAPPRIDARQKVTGQALYLEDLPEPPGIVYAATIRSPYSHARIRAIDSSAAERLGGFAGIVHAHHLDGLNLHLQSTTTEQQFIPTDKARFDGDLIGMVAAWDLRTARAAAELVHIEWDVLEPVFSLEQALAPGAPLIHEELGSNLCLTDDLAWGDVEEGFRQADHVVEGSWYSCPVFHHPMEPTTSFTVSFDGQRIEVWAPNNRPWVLLEELAHIFGLSQKQVRVHTPYVGGSFGAKDLFSSEVQVAAALSLRAGRPVKLVATEVESFRSTARHAATYRARLGLSSSGAITALDVRLDMDTGAYFTGAEIVTRNAVTSAMGAYRVPHLRVEAQTVYTNKVPAATFRSTGRSQTTYGLECLVDEAVRRLGMDPLTFRQRNLLARGEPLAPPTWRRHGVEAPAEAPPIDTDFPEMLRRAVEGLAVPLPPRWERLGEGSWARGRGYAVSFRRSSDFGIAQAKATLDRAGTVTVHHNAPDLGEGAHTVIQLIAADTLSVPPEMVRLGDADTANELYFSGASSQRTTVQMGTAVANASVKLKEEILTSVARLHEDDPKNWELKEGLLTRSVQAASLGGRENPQRFEEVRVTLKELATSLPEELNAKGAYRAQEAGENPFEGHDHWSPGAAAAEVAVDRGTGEVRLMRYCAIGDAGKVIHYPSAKGQLEGGAVLGIGLALLEELLYQDGQLQNADPFQYRLPLMRDLPPDFHVSILENRDGPGPFGSKAMAQTSVPCVVPAIANAIYDAVGAKQSEAPFTPERVLRAMGALSGA